MYDLNKRAYFSYLGELRMLLAEMPDDTEVCTGGVLGSYLHFSKERNLVSFDDEDLSPDAYEELEDDDGTLSAIAESREYDECSIREQWLEAAGYVFVKRKRSAVEEIFCMNIQAAS